MEKSGEDLRRVSYTSALDDSKRDFFLYIPRGYESDRTRSWPVILFLHGDGERGDGRGDLDFLLKNGPLYEAWIQKRDLPFLIIAPQLPMFGRNLPGGPPYLVNRSRAEIPARQTNGVPKHTEDTPAPGQMEGATAIDASVLGYSLPNGWERVESDVIEVLDTVLSDYRADRKRVYLTGLSYGGFGTWYLAGRHPERFAAISPISGWGRPELIAPIAKVKLPVWAFSGGKDQIVETRYFFMGLNLLRELGDPDVRFTTHQDMGHDVWNRIYAGADLYDWFLSKSR
jgi:predicted peptidase